MVLCLLALLALPAGAVMEKGEPNITAQTTMKEVRNNPGIKNSGFYTYSQDKDCPPGQALWEMTTVEGYTNEYVAEGCAKGLNLVIENYNNGVQVTHSIYTDAEKAEDRTKNNTGLFYFPAKAENARFALILAGSGANESAELEEGACTAWQLHELGYAAFILRYRVWTDASDDAPLEDIGRAMQYIEEHAAEFGIQPEQYAIVGYSMGGHLTGLFGTESVGYKHYNVPKPAALLLGYPMAYYIAHRSQTAQKFLYMLVMLPMCMSFLLRTLAWVGLLQDTGIINNILDAIGIGRLRLIRTPGAVILGMVYNYLPYMILPLYGVIVKIDPRLIEAAEDLGCNSTQVFSRVVLPLSVPGILSGMTMVFVPAVSTFYISQKLGGTDTVLIGDVIERQFKQGNNPNLGAALSLVLMILVFICTGIMNRFGGGNEEGGVIV